MGGRIDHAIANLNAVVTHAHLNLVLVGDKSTARLLPAGRSRVAPLPGVEGPHCSLVPLAGPCTITTTGLTWNMSGRPLPSRIPLSIRTFSNSIVRQEILHVLLGPGSLSRAPALPAFHLQLALSAQQTDLQGQASAPHLRKHSQGFAVYAT